MIEFSDFSKLHDRIWKAYEELIEKEGALMDKVVEDVMGVPLLNERNYKKAKRLLSRMERDLKKMERMLREKEKELKGRWDGETELESFRKTYEEAKELVEYAQEEMEKAEAVLEEGVS